MNEELINNVRQWFHDKKIIQKSNPLKQLGKTQEELNETRDSAVKLAYAMAVYNNHGMYFTKDQIDDLMHELKDGIGDTIVTLIGVCEMKGFDIIDLATNNNNEGFANSLPEDSIKLLDEAQKVLTNLVIFESLMLDVKYGIGQLMCCVGLLAVSYGLSLEECLQQAYDVISKRTGEVVDGVFIKDKEVQQ